MRFLIRAWDYDVGSGGGMALHRLAHNLTLLGHRASLTCDVTAVGWLGTPDHGRLKAFPDEIVVYPEIITGNPYEGQRVVRWLLQSPGFFPGNGDGVYGETDLVMQWKRCYTAPQGYRVAGELTAFRDHEHFQNFGIERAGECYAVRKGKAKPLTAHAADSLCIEEYAVWGGDAYLIRTFNQRKKFVCYDHMSTLPNLAAMCGCPSLVVPDGFRTREELEANGDMFAGVAWGEADWERALATLPKAHAQMDAATAKSVEQTKKFVELCKEQWDEYGSERR